MEKNSSEKKYTFDEFRAIIARLRAKDGCPWDREQTHESLRQCMVEEAYETVEAIDHSDMDNLKEELGDVLLQVVMHAQIGEENQEFTMDDVIDAVAEKMVYRHPHVFGDVKVSDSGDVLKNWEELKKAEKHEQSVVESIVRVPKALPANIRAAKVQKKAAKIGFEFPDVDAVLKKVEEELSELKEAMKSEGAARVNEKFGDLMFSMVNLSRFLGVNAENSLTNATEKFINRLESVENLAKKKGLSLDGMSLEELDVLWEQIKELRHI